MGEQLATLAGEPVDLDGTDEAFAAAMAAPAVDRPGMAAPTKRPPEPAPDAENAPHGWTWDGDQWRPKKSHGRPRTDRPRVAPATSPAAEKTPPAGNAAPPKGDWRRPLRETLEALWLGLAITPVPEQAFGLQLGRMRARIRAQAYLIETNAEQLAGGINQIGQHNRFVAAALARLSTGEAGLWVLPTAMLLAPFVIQSGQLWGGQVDDVTLEALASKTETDAAAYLKTMAAQAAEMAVDLVEAPA